MRIKQINIKNYGPLRNFYTQCNDVQVIYGDNEAGKTALVDALTGALFQKKSIFSGQDRFEKNSPSDLEEDVTLILEHSGREYTFPGSFKFEEITNLPHYHLAGLFIIRAGDLTLREGDKKWQDKVKEFLSGTPVNVERIKEKIGEDVGLTPGGNWSNRQPLYKKSMVEERQERKNALLRAIERLKDIDEKKRDLREKRQRRNELEKKRENIKLLQAYKRHQRIKKVFSEWSTQRILIQDYERYTEEDSEKWLKKDKHRESLLSTRENYRKELQNVNKELNSLNEQISQLTEEKQRLINQKDRTDTISLTQDLQKLPSLREENREVSLRSPFYGFLGSVLLSSGVFLFLLQILGRFNVLHGLIPFFLLGTGLYFLIFFHLARSKKLSLKKLEESILEKGRKIWSELEDIESAKDMCAALNTRIPAIESKLEYMVEQKEKKLSQLKEIREKMESIDEEIKSIQKDINDLRNRTGLSSLSQLVGKLTEKQKIKLQMQTKEDALQDYLSSTDPVVWEKEAKKNILPPDIDEKELTNEGKIDQELSSLDKQIQHLSAEITSFTQGELGRLKIKEVTDIWRELKKVEDELNLSYQDKDAALLAWDVLDRVGEEMDQVLLNAISDNRTGVSFYFNLITSGRYKKVRWEEGSVYVRTNKGEDYPAEVLSSGTQDQLFFSFRLGILKRGFPEGVFILLDDAFLTSDVKRREDQVKVCKMLAREGWQIFYFTVDEHLRDLFSKIFDIKPINLNRE